MGRQGAFYYRCPMYYAVCAGDERDIPRAVKFDTYRWPRCARRTHLVRCLISGTKPGVTFHALSNSAPDTAANDPVTSTSPLYCVINAGHLAIWRSLVSSKYPIKHKMNGCLPYEKRLLLPVLAPPVRVERLVTQPGYRRFTRPGCCHCACL